MNKIIEFIHKCDAFFVATKNNEFPSTRPFGAMMEYDNEIYICTNKEKLVCKQILDDNHICISAIERYSRNWMRFNAKAYLVNDQKLKDEFFRQCPRLKEIYLSPTNPNFVMFKLDISNLEFFE